LPFQTSLGIDIGRSSVSVAYLKTSVKGVKMAAHALYPVEQGQTSEEQAEVVRGLVRDFLGKHRISPTAVFLGIAREKAMLRYVELPLAVKENLRDTLAYEMEKYVPFPAERAYFDFQVMTEDKESGKMRLLLVVVKRESVDPYVSPTDRLGNWISGVEIRSTALANFFWSQFKTSGADSGAFAYLNGHYMEAGLLAGGLLTYSRAVPFPEGGDDVGARISGEVEALREISGYEGPLEMICCFPEGDLPYADFFRRQEGVEVIRVDLSGTEIPSIAMIPAYGLALKGFQKGAMDINLLPVKLRKRANKAGYYAMVALVGLVGLSGLFWGGSAFLRQQLHLKQLDGEIHRLEAQVKQIDQIKSERDRAEERIGYLNRLFGSGASAVLILKELSDRIPDNAWVNVFTFSEKGVEIQGEAASASELIPLLEASPLFNDVTFLSTITKSNEGKERFRIGLKVRGLG
jgi:Tfp pilus assembly protein PilN